MIRAMLAAALLAAAGAGASAAVLPKTDARTSPSNLVEVQHGRWVPGRRYTSPPPGWRRHHVRPHDWRQRRCVIVGPAWFCP